MNSTWKDDENLKSDLEKYVSCRMLKREILLHMQKDYSQYCWSSRTLTRRLAFFNIKFIDYSVPLEDVQDAVQSELAGPASKLGYRAMAQKVRIKHKLNFFMS